MVCDKFKRTVAWFCPLSGLLYLCLSTCSWSQETKQALIQSGATEDDRISSGRINLQITEEQGAPYRRGTHNASSVPVSERDKNDAGTFRVVSQYSREILFDKPRHIYFERTSAGPDVPESKVRYDNKSVRGYTAFPDTPQAKGTRLVTVASPGGAPMELEMWCACLRHRLKEVLDLAPTRVNLVDAVRLNKRYRFRLGGSGDEIAEVFEIELKPKPVITRIEVTEKNHGTIQTWQVAYAHPNNAIAYPTEVIQTQGNHKTRYRCISASLNCGPSDQDLDFGKYPEGALVQDMRFASVVGYYQGKHQFTDEELFNASKDPNLLGALEQQSSQNLQRRNGVLAWSIFAIIALSIIGVVARLRTVVRTSKFGA